MIKYIRPDKNSGDKIIPVLQAGLQSMLLDIELSSYSSLVVCGLHADRARMAACSGPYLHALLTGPPGFHDTHVQATSS